MDGTESNKEKQITTVLISYNHKLWINVVSIPYVCIAAGFSSI